jgi:hypothetical protein
LGHPGESRQSIENTRQWLLAVRPEEFDATVLTIYPGTPYHDEATEDRGQWTYAATNGDRLYFRSIDQFTDTPYYKGIPGAYESFVWTDHLTSEELVMLRDDLESDVRARLDIPWPKDAAALNYEHSMGLMNVRLAQRRGADSIRGVTERDHVPRRRRVASIR